jgi:DnaK suppressor protein
MNKKQLTYFEKRLIEERARVMKEGRYLWHVNQALGRLYNNPERFGTCESCGSAINFERLDALPHARLCISCKEKEEDAKRR